MDVIAILTESPNPRKYWSVLKTRLKKEGSQLATNCSQLKMQSSDGKFYKTDVADTEQVFRLIQSIPSPKAEPFKLWLAKIANERIDEMQDPELSIDRSLQQYLNQKSCQAGRHHCRKCPKRIRGKNRKKSGNPFECESIFRQQKEIKMKIEVKTIK